MRRDVDFCSNGAALGAEIVARGLIARYFAEQRGERTRTGSPSGLLFPPLGNVKPVKPVSPKELYDLYTLFPDDGKREFIELIARISTAEELFLMVNELQVSEKKRFSDIVFGEITHLVFPVLLAEACRTAREMPNLIGEELEKRVNEAVRKSTEEYNREIGELERSKLKEQRDRKSDPETIRRNVEICNLRKQDKKTWTQGRLAKKYGITTRAIRKILKDEEKWRRMAAELRTN